jgi:LDH2 family malate/lactate/ureidoglycolate dehydrogenase
MAVYPTSETDRRVDGSALHGVVAAIFRVCGMSAEDADLLARSLVKSDLRGIHSHGTLRVPDYVKKLTIDGVDPRGRPEIVTATGAAIVIDGHNSMGQIGATLAMRTAIERAREIGVAFAAVRGSNHCGAMDAYTLMAADAGMIGLAGTNALPTMAPWGGADKIVGINPLSIALPAKHHPPFCLDFAFGATAHGKIRVYHQKGSPIPPGWAFDTDGRPTTDAGAALEGLIQPIGQHKGIGLGMAIGMLSSLLSGAAYGTESGNMIDGAKVGTDGHFCAAIDITAFEDVGRFRERVDAIIDQVHDSRRVAGTDRLLVPGELEAEFEQAYSQDGILLAGATIEAIAAQAKSLGVDASPLHRDRGRSPVA